MDIELFEKTSDPDVPPMQLQAAKAKTTIDNLCKLDIYSRSNARLSKILCSIGPKTRDSATILKMIEAGMDIACLNFTEGSYDYHAETMKNVRTAMNNYSKKTGINCTLAIALETQGPQIRTGILEEGVSATVELKKGEAIKLTTDRAYREKSSAQVVYVDFEEIHTTVAAGNLIYADCGAIVILCTNIQGTQVIGVVERGGTLGSNVALNLPGILPNLPVLSDKDLLAIKFGVSQNIDLVIASFVRNLEDIEYIRNVLAKERKDIPLIVTIEEQEALKHVGKIIRASEGVYLGRRDLGVEIPIEKLFLAQKSIAGKCNKIGKPIICPTDLFYGMTTNIEPMCSENADGANAILDGFDCLALRERAYLGKCPIRALVQMANVCKEADAAYWQKRWYSDISAKIKKPITVHRTICLLAVETAYQCLAAAILVVSSSKHEERVISRYKPTCPIIFVTRSMECAKISKIYRAIYPVFIDGHPSSDILEEVRTCTEYGMNYGKAVGIIKSSDPVVIVSRSAQHINTVNTLHIEYVSDIVDKITFL